MDGGVGFSQPFCGAGVLGVVPAGHLPLLSWPQQGRQQISGFGRNNPVQNVRAVGSSLTSTLTIYLLPYPYRPEAM